MKSQKTVNAEHAIAWGLIRMNYNDGDKLAVIVYDSSGLICMAEKDGCIWLYSNYEFSLDNHTEVVLTMVPVVRHFKEKWEELTKS